MVGEVVGGCSVSPCIHTYSCRQKYPHQWGAERGDRCQDSQISPSLGCRGGVIDARTHKLSLSSSYSNHVTVGKSVSLSFIFLNCKMGDISTYLPLSPSQSYFILK